MKKQLKKRIVSKTLSVILAWTMLMVTSVSSSAFDEQTDYGNSENTVDTVFDESSDSEEENSGDSSENDFSTDDSEITEETDSNPDDTNTIIGNDESSSEEASTNEDNILEVNNDVITGTVTSDSNNIDFSNIVIEVYSSQLIEDLGNIQNYSHTFVNNVTVNSDGTFSVDRPSECAYFEVNLNSIPNGFGVKGNAYFLGSYESTVAFSIQQIANIELENVSFTSADIMIYDSQGELLSANSNITNYSVNCPLNPNENVNSLYVSCMTTVGGINENLNGIINISDYDGYTKADIYETLGFITYEEKIEQYVNLLEQHAYVDDSTSIIQELIDYRSNYNNVSTNISTQNLNSVSIISRIDALTRSPLSTNLLQRSMLPSEYTYISMGTVSGTKYAVHYETSGSNSVTATMAQAVLNRAEAIALYYKNLGFIEPRAESVNNSSGKYHIYLIPSTSLVSKGRTTPVIYTSGPNVGQFTGSYIKISFDHTSSLNSEKISTLAHEIFHSVQYEYFYINSNNNYWWISESFASYAGIAYCRSISQPIENENTITEKVRLYLAHTILSLNDSSISNRDYGMLMIPMYLSANYSGMTTIKNILTNIQSYYPNEISTIMAGLPSSASFSDIFGLISRNNARPHAFYNYINDDSWQYSSSANYEGSFIYISDINGTAPTTTLPANSSKRYRSVAANGYTKFQISNTITSGTYTNLAIYLVYKKGNGTFTYSKLTMNSNSKHTWTISNFIPGSTSTYNNEIDIVVVNTNSDSATVTYSISGIKKVS